ncbi:MAG: DUF2971 domain-containing protein [Gammaproteobacteria bacterium]|nr:DUF2971 domain-containing protein [Gammaproteobacteria bacterium]
MRAYYFTTASFGLSALQKRRLKVARIHELNDPFEFLGVELSDPDFRKIIKETKRELSNGSGLVCFSKSWRHPMLWAHYGEKHRGICLGFDVADEKLEHVSYLNSRFPKPSNVHSGSFMRKLLYTKFAHWSYEDEYRLYVQLVDQEDGLYFVPFSDELKLRQVIVGCESTESRADISNALGADSHLVEAFKARPAFRSFKITRQKDDRRWT